MINHLISSNSYTFNMGFVDGNFKRLPADRSSLAIQQLLANPAFNNKELLKSYFINNCDYSDAIFKSFNHRGITVPTLINSSNNRKVSDFLETSLINGYYNPYIWDLFTYLLSRDHIERISEFSFTDRGLVVGFLSCDSKGRFEGGQVVLNDGNYSIDCEGVTNFHTLPLRDKGKEFMCFIPIQSITAWFDQIIQATKVQIVGLTYSSSKSYNLTEKIKKVTKPADADIIKVPYEFDSKYYTFWSTND